MLIFTAIRNLFRNPRRTLAILLTVALGTGSLFIYNGFNTGIMNQYRENLIRGRFGHGQINTVGYRERVFEKPWEHWITDFPELRTKLGGIPGVSQIFPRVGFSALLTNGSINVGGVGTGVDGVEEAKFFTTLNIIEGKMLTSEPDGIILGKGLAQSLDVKVGDRVTVLTNTIHGSINGADLTVTGIFHLGPKEFDDVVFRLPLAQVHNLLDTDRVESVALGLRSLDDWNTVATQVKAAFPNLEATPFAVLDKVYYQNSVDWLKSQFNIILIIILTIVILGIFNTVSTSVLERKQEIGNLRANGESQWDVMKMLALEGLLLGMAGALGGILIGLGVVYGLIPNGIFMPPAPGITRQYFVRVELQPSMALAVFAMGSIATLLGTVLAALRVVRLPIGEALRST